MATLSVVLATFNEEKNIARCLDSVRKLANEIIIVDGTSSDKTVEIAKRYGAKVTITENRKNFHINKQQAIDNATKDWVLQMDADEVVPEALQNEIKQILSEQDNDYNGYWIPRKNYFLGRFLQKGGQYPDYTIRLYRNGSGKLPQKDVHEQAVITGNVGYLMNPLLHFPYENFGVYLKKWSTYNHFAARQIRDELQHKSYLQRLLSGINYVMVKPSYWFVSTYIRHKGFYDSWQGFVFSFFSALRFPVSYYYSLSL